MTPAEALAHPTWDMGRVITTNSATLVNKGLELLEAHLLYGVDLDRIDVVVHPQSIVHSMVQFVDGSTLAQCSPPDMKLPIALGSELAGTAARGGPAVRLDAPRPAGPSNRWTTRRSRRSNWRVRRAGSAGRRPAVFNAANEICVDAFHDGRIGFLQILDIVSEVLGQHVARARASRRAQGLRRAQASVRGSGREADVGSKLVGSEDLTLEVVLAADAWARRRATELIETGHQALDGTRDLHRRRRRCSSPW